jgi:rubrerythrin
MNSRRILEMALRVETLAEKNYADLAGLFPEAMPLFALLTREESRHADIITITMGFLDMDALPPEFSIDMLPLIRETLDIGELIEKKIRTREITLTEALDLSIEMEETGAEAYFQDVMRRESTNNALNYVKQFYTDSRHHADLIREFREALELKKAGTRRRAAAGNSKSNCWEFKRCGRQPTGTYEHGLGVCPAAVEQRLDGMHGGVNAGRACWVVAGTMCGGEIQGTFAHKFRDCRKCDFYNGVREEEQEFFRSSAELFLKLGKVE